MDRTEKLLEKLPQGTAALLYNPSNVFYISGFTGEGLVLAGPGLKVLITDFRYEEAAQKQCPEFTVACIRTGVSHVQLAAEYVRSAGVENVAYEENYVTVRQLDEIEAAFEGIQITRLGRPVEALRAIKDEDELSRIEHACDITCRAFEYICGYIAPGMTERQIQLALDYKMLELGAKGLAFNTIVASGENGSLPHAVPSDREVRNGDMITLDFGARWDGYCADMTRTVALGQPSEAMRRIYDLVLEAQEKAQAALRPGEVCADIDGIARGIIACAGHGDHFGHGLGHSVGIDIHEEPRLSTRCRELLSPGIVITVEPGVYVPGLGGVRIENTCVVTQSGARTLCYASKELRIL